MVRESKLEKTEHGLVPKGEGWFVLNMRDAVWRHGFEAFPGMEPNDLVLWVESRRAPLVAGDTLIDRGHGLEFPADWANKGVPPEQILEALRRCSSCRSSSCSRRTGRPPTEPPSSARSQTPGR